MTEQSKLVDAPLSDPPTRNPSIDLDKVPSSKATIYASAVSLGAAEAALIWQRFAAFNVLNGFFLVALIGRGADDLTPRVLLVSGAALLVINGIWHILNFAGWQNHRLFYHLASKIFEHQRLNLLTDYFARRRNPGGPIYWAAQAIPTISSAGSVPCIALGMQRLDLNTEGNSLLTASGIWLISALVVSLFEYGVIATDPGKVEVVDPA